MKALHFGLALGLFAASSAANAVVVVQYSQIGKSNTLHLTNSGTAFTTGTIGAPTVTITLNDPFSNATLVTTGKISFTGIGTGLAVVAGSTARQAITSGTFAITASAPINFASYSGTNILSGTFTNGFIYGELGTRTPQLSVNIPTGTFASVTSDFFFDPRLFLTDLSITTSGSSPLLALIPAGGGNQKLRNFRSSSTGTFDMAVVPEPSS